MFKSESPRVFHSQRTGKQFIQLLNSKLWIIRQFKQENGVIFSGIASQYKEIQGCEKHWKQIDYM